MNPIYESLRTRLTTESHVWLITGVAGFIGSNLLETLLRLDQRMVFTNVYNPRSAVVRKAEYRRTLVRRGATIGANATVVCGVTIGEYAFVAAGAVVTRNVEPHALMAGVPARLIGWVSHHGERLTLPLTGDGEAVCPHTGQKYALCDGQCSLAG